jgi:hypothetical protein
LRLARACRHIVGILSLLIVAAAGPAVIGAEHAFVGSKKCKTCHLKEWKSWSETKMANAMEALNPGNSADAKKSAGLDPAKDYTTDATCLRCHSTGFGKEGGFVDLASTPDLAGVGCEMCHGAGGTYTQSGHMSLKNKEYKKASLVAVGLVGTITEQQCRGCHNTDSPFVGDDYVFDFEANKEKGTHQKFPLRYKH